MELFRHTSFDFLGRKWWFILPSLFLIAAGAASLVAHGGPQYGIDFTGGAVMDVQWQGVPPIERLRAAVEERVKDASVVAAHDASGSNEVLISTPSHFLGAFAVAAGVALFGSMVYRFGLRDIGPVDWARPRR